MHIYAYHNCSDNFLSSVQVNVYNTQLTSENALEMHDSAQIPKSVSLHWGVMETIPEIPRNRIDPLKVHQQQLQEPLFKYPYGDKGCGEAIYLKLISQLFGERMLIANATGSSSIFGGALPTTPWAKNSAGRGPAWSNSLFEDNAEFGLGYRLSLDQQTLKARRLLKSLRSMLDAQLVDLILDSKQDTEQDIDEQRSRIDQLNGILKGINNNKSIQLLGMTEALVKKSVWIVGGDGWAYDIGFGGIDHVIASDRNVNILILDNEVYDNTGGQTSKASPLGSSGKFASNGKHLMKKDLGRMLMTYDHVYVASIAIGADQEQALRAIHEAEQYNGPSVIIAYTHSSKHGMDSKLAGLHQKVAVDSGQWLLYRNDPRRLLNDRNPLQLDSKIPSLKVSDFFRMEGRFSKLINQSIIEDGSRLNEYQKQIDDRYNYYFSRATSWPLHRAKMVQDHRIKNKRTWNK